MSSSTPPGFNDKLDGDVGLVGNFVVWSMTLVSGAFLGFRLYIRTLRMQLWWDDRALLAGWLFTIAQSGVFSEMLRRGFAKATIDEPTILLLMLIGDNLQKFALSLTKLSFSLTLLRIFTTGWQKWTIVGLLLVVNSYYIAHLFLVWLNICDFLSAASDFILAFLPLSRMLEVTMKSSDKRAAALITTSVGVIAGLAGLVKGFEGIRLLDTENTRYFHSIWVFHIVGIAEPNATIVACSIPILRTFFRTQRQLGGERPALPRGRGPYVGSDSAGKFTTPGGRGNKRQSSAAFSDHVILKGGEGGGLGGGAEASEEGESPGIMRTQTFAVTFDHMAMPGGGSSRPEAGGIEMLSRSAPS
ncbi:hypothetical protein PG985_000884 [Apiospora marii]|uniref:uncharacterized protein n=1 Tax=Apiospora marii TaxID=335849 RepID=UPI00312E576F